MIEYLLVLTLTVALVLAVSKGVGAPLQKYMQDNVLDLVGCMLRVGQFPTKSFGLCQKAIEIKMDVAGNLGGTGDGTGGGSSTNSDNSGSSNDNKTSGDENSNANGDGSDSASDTDSDSGRARVRSNSGTGSLNDTGNDSAFGDGPTTRMKISNDETGSSGSKEIATGNNGTNFGETTVIVRRVKREDGRIGGSFMVGGDAQESSEAEGPESYRSVTSINSPVSEFENSSTSGRFTVPEAKENDVRGPAQTEDVDFSFLKMIKWIIIIGVLFFIVVFAASQLNSIRKGWTD